MLLRKFGDYTVQCLQRVDTTDCPDLHFLSWRIISWTFFQLLNIIFINRIDYRHFFCYFLEFILRGTNNPYTLVEGRFGFSFKENPENYHVTSDFLKIFRNATYEGTFFLLHHTKTREVYLLGSEQFLKTKRGSKFFPFSLVASTLSLFMALSPSPHSLLSFAFRLCLHFTVYFQF